VLGGYRARGGAGSRLPLDTGAARGHGRVAV